MGFKITGSGGSGGSLPDYSTTKILYPRKWINGNQVWEISYFDIIPAYDSAVILLENIKAQSGIVVPIECSFAFLTSSQWFKHDDWGIYKTGNDVYLRVINSNPYEIWVSGVLKYVIDFI